MEIASERLVSVPIYKLARKLNALKRLRQGHSPFTIETNPEHTKEELDIKLKRLQRDLGAMDLGVEWDDSNEMYVVYDLDSRKD